MTGGVVLLGLAMMDSSGAGAAEPHPVTIPDQPLRIQPEVAEIGMGNWTPPSSGTQPTDPVSGDGDPGGGSGSSGGGTGSTDALGLMESQSWGQQADNAAQALNVNPNALAATCMIESQCNSSAQNGSSTGAFQMQGAAFQDGLNTALQANPSLESKIVPGDAGINDPVTQSIAAAGYLLQANQALQDAQIADPTVVDARGYYEFGPSQGVAVARANTDMLMSDVVSDRALNANNISPTMTVGEWKASVAAKTGGAGNQPVMS